MNALHIKTLPAHAVILAAGKGTRMKSDLPKVLHELGGAALIVHVLAAAITAGIKTVTTVVGYGHEQVKATIDEWGKGVKGVNFYYSRQAEQNGTGHAVMTAEPESKGNAEWVLVLLGDVPLLKSKTIIQALQSAQDLEADAVVITTELADPTSYGRILRNASGDVIAIREEKDASPQERTVKEVNTGIFIFRDSLLWQNLKKLKSHNAQNEYYLTDLVEVLVGQGRKVTAFIGDDPLEFTGVNSIEQLNVLQKLFSKPPAKGVAQ